MQNLVLFPYVHLHTTTFRVWKNNIGERGIKDFFRGGNQRRGGLFEKSGVGINTLLKRSFWNMLLHVKETRSRICCFLIKIQQLMHPQKLRNFIRHCFQAVVTETNVPFYPLYQIYTVKK